VQEGDESRAELPVGRGLMRKQMMLGGVGGLTPLFAGLLILDVPVLDTYIRQVFDSHARGELYLLGYAAKATMLFAVGAFWAYLHRSEPSAFKIYQLGIVAPAIIVGFINTAEIRSLTPKGRVERRITSSQVSPTVSLLRTPIELSSSGYTQKNHGKQYRLSWIAEAEAACPDGTCAATNGSCSSGACPPSWFEKFTWGFLSRPAPHIVRCGDELSAVASIPYASSVTVNIQRGAVRTCEFSVDGATLDSGGAVFSCRHVNASLVVPKGYAASLTESSNFCAFNVYGH
jgi:hypothetical protein